MKNIVKVSVVALLSLNSLSYAGGDLTPVTEFETNEAQEAIKAVEVEVPKVVPPVVVEAKQDTPWYVGAGLVAAQVDNGNCQDKTYGFLAKGGYDFNEYFGVEARALKTNWDYEGAKVEHIGAFLKPQYPITEDISLYALVGYANTQLEKKFLLDESGFAFGAGLAYDVSKEDNLALFVDYERLLQKSNIPDIDAIAFGMAYKF